jgi:transposase
MPKAHSQDLREGVIDAVELDGMNRLAAAHQFGVGESTAVKWLEHIERRGSGKPVGTGGTGPRF